MTLLDELKKDTNEPWTKEHPEIKSIVSKIVTANRNAKHELIVNGELPYLKKLNRYFSSEGFDCLISEKQTNFPGLIRTYDAGGFFSVNIVQEEIKGEQIKYNELNISW